MKKKNKFILGTALTAGVIGCFGTAFALYKKDAGDVEISIGKITSHADSTAVIDYSLAGITTYSAYDESNSENNVAIDLSTTKLSPTYNKIYAKVPLSFSYSTEDANFTSQEAVVGRFSVTVDIAEAVRKAGDVKVSAALKGYGSTDTYFTRNKVSDFFDTTYNSETATATKYIDTAVDKSSIYCLLTIDMSSSLTDDKFFDLTNTLNGANAFDVKLNWEPYKNQTDFDGNLVPNAYVRGDYSDWQIREGYQMVPNIFGSKTNAKGYPLIEWQYKILKNFTTIKVYDSVIDATNDDNCWVACRGGKKDAKGNSVIPDGDMSGNATIYSDNSYDIYYVRYADKDEDKGFYVDYKSGTAGDAAV